jgi:hypothetical protein
MEGTPAPSPADVRRIVALANPVIRNLEITQCYSRLAVAVAARTGAGANWCSYATWASRQAGSTIRGEDLLADLERRLSSRRWLVHPFASLWRSLLRRGLLRPGSRLGRLTAQLHTPFDAVERASDAVARGNLAVFAEIGLVFAEYLAEPKSAASLRPGDPPEGQRYLRQAFARYERARAEPDPKARAELLVLANLEIGLHEQTRLQPLIREALDAGSVTAGDLGRRVVRGKWAILAGWLAKRLQRQATAVAREAVTDALMVLTLPARVLVLGAHLDDPFPADLLEPADADLVELLARFEPVPPARDDCGARDWSELAQRMHYISHLFRAFHESESLADPPFTPDQVTSFGRGVVPSGDL